MQIESNAFPSVVFCTGDVAGKTFEILSFVFNLEGFGWNCIQGLLFSANVLKLTYYRSRVTLTACVCGLAFQNLSQKWEWIILIPSHKCIGVSCLSYSVCPVVPPFSLHQCWVDTDICAVSTDGTLPGADPGFWSGGGSEPKFAQNCLRTAWFWKKCWGKEAALWIRWCLPLKCVGEWDRQSHRGDHGDNLWSHCCPCCHDRYYCHCHGPQPPNAKVTFTCL